KLNRKRTAKVSFDSNADTRRVFNTKVVSVALNANNQSTSIAMSGAPLTYGQFLGGRNVSASVNIVTNDPSVVVDIMSMFHGSTVYDSINNMMEQARGLLKTRAPYTPTSAVFQRMLNRGSVNVFPDEPVSALRALRAQIKSDQFIRIVGESVSTLSGKINDIFFSQEEPMVMYHPLLNSMGFKTFYPTRADVKTLEGNPGYLSIVLSLQWIDRRLFMQESLRYKKTLVDDLSFKGLAWYLTFADVETDSDKIKENSKSQTAASQADGGIIEDVILERNSARKDAANAQAVAKDVRYRLSNLATTLSAGPPLMAYAIARHLDYIDAIKTRVEEEYKLNPDLDVDVLKTKLVGSGPYISSLVTVPSGFQSSDIANIGVAAGSIGLSVVGEKLATERTSLSLWYNRASSLEGQFLLKGALKSAGIRTLGGAAAGGIGASIF